MKDLVVFFKQMSFHLKLSFLFLSFLSVHIVYFLIFFAIDKPWLSLLNVFSMAFYLFCIFTFTKSLARLSAILFLTKIEVFSHAFICCYVLGWEYGFQNIIFTFMAMTLFNTVSYRIINYIFPFVEICALWFLLQNTRGYADVDLFYADLIYLLNFGAIVFVFFLMAFDLLRSLDVQRYQAAADLNEELIQKANQDSLTGVSNRNCFYNNFYSYEKFDRKFVSVAVGDIDNFKKLNDTYGHAFGDEVLVRIASVLSSANSNEIEVFRWGGEEFLLFFNNTTLKKSYETLDRLRKKISDLNFVFEGKEVKVTMTFGIANVYINSSIDINSVIKKADDMLYEGKNSGKNRIIGGLVITN